MINLQAIKLLNEGAGSMGFSYSTEMAPLSCICPSFRQLDFGIGTALSSVEK